MKKLIAIFGTVFLGASSFAQGTLIFATRVAGQVDAPIFRPVSTTEGLGYLPNSRAQLYLLTGGNTFTPVGPIATFHDPSVNPLLTRYIVSPGTIQIDGVAPGQNATFVLRAWDGASFDAAVALVNAGDPAGVWGQSAEFTIRLGGQVPGEPAIPDPALVGLYGFTMISTAWPEPSSVALGLLGAAALLYRRRS